MPNPRLAERYAKSLTDIAVEYKSLEKVYENLLFIEKTCEASREFVTFLKSPVINADKKEKIFTAIFKGQFTDLTQKFVILLIKKGRERFLPEIIEAAIRRYRKINNIQEVKMTTAIPISKELNVEIIAAIKKEIPGQKIDLKTKIKKDIIGGFVLKTNNTIYDASVARQLKDIEKQFLIKNI